MAELLPNVWDEEDDDVLFVGIGTILDKTPRLGYDHFRHAAPAHVRPRDNPPDSSRWHIYGVRGPLTARALQLDKSFVMTDPAICSHHARVRRAASSGVIFVPHWKSVPYGSWATICDKLGN